MPAWAKVGRLVLIALRNVEQQSRLEERQGKRSDVAMQWLNWLLKEKALAGTKTLWPQPGEAEGHDELIRLRDQDHLTWETIGVIQGRDGRDVRRTYTKLKDWFHSL
jgi:hypothetical protein